MSLFEQKYNNNIRAISGLVNIPYQDDVVLLCDTSVGAVAIQLQSIPANKWNTLWKLYVVDGSANALVNNITITAPVGYLINGASSITINNNGASLIIRVASNTNFVGQYSVISGGGGGGGYTTIEQDGVALPQRTTLDFIEDFIVTDNGAKTQAKYKGVNWGKTIFVSQTTGNDSTALPYRVDKPYLTPETAIAIANYGDTILFESGTYIVNGIWGKNGLTYRAIGDVIVNQIFFGSPVFTEPDANPIDIRVIGDFRFVAQPVNFLFWKTNINSKFYIDIEEVTANWVWALDDSGSREGDFFISVNRVLRGTFYNRIQINKNGFAKINIKYADTRNGYQGVFIEARHENPIAQKGIVEANIDFALSNANFGDYIMVINSNPNGIQQGKMSVNYKGTIIHTINSPYGFLHPNFAINDLGGVLCVINGGGHINFDGILETDGGIAECISRAEFSGYNDSAPSTITANIERGVHNPLPYLNNPSYSGYIGIAHGKNANIRLSGVVNSDSKGALFSVGDYPHTYGTDFGLGGGRIHHANFRVTNKGSGCFMAKRGLITQAIVPTFGYPSVETMYIDNNCEFVSENPNPTLGGITEYTITNAGANYPDGYYYNWNVDTSIPILGTGIDAKASFIIQGGQVVLVMPSQLGIDYTEGETITIDALNPILPQGRIDTISSAGVSIIGRIGTFGSAGVSVGASSFSNVVAIGGSGTLAIFDVVTDGLGGYSVTLPTGFLTTGRDYLVGDILIIDGALVGGVSVVNDITINVLTLQTLSSLNTAQSSTSGAGTFATFDITEDGVGGYIVTRNQSGVNYVVADTITINGSLFPLGVDGVNDITISVSTLLVGGGFTATASVKPLSDIQLSMQNSVETFTFVGLSVGANVYTNIPTDPALSGVNATFDITTDGLGGYSVALNNGGVFYNIGGVLTIKGSVLGGVDGVNDLTITILTLAQNQKIKIQGKYIGNNQKDARNVDDVGLFTYGISQNLEYQDNI